MLTPSRSPSIQVIWQVGAFAVVVLLAHLVGAFAALMLQLVLPIFPVKVTGLPLCAVAVLVASVLMVRYHDRLPAGSIGIGFDRPWIRQLIVGVAIGGALITLAWLVFRWSGWCSTQLNREAEHQVPRLIAAVVYCLGIAVHEELLFRGYAFQIVARRNLPAALVLSGVLFVAIHLPNAGGTEPLAIINCFLAHLLFAACYLKTRSLWLPIALHFGWNFVEAFVLGLPFFGRPSGSSILATELQTNLWTGFSFGADGGVVVTIILAVVTLLIWRGMRQRHPVPDLMSTAMRAPVRADTPAAAAPPRTAGTGVLTPDLAKPQRILAIDVLRGVALLGILPMNMQIFAQHPSGVMYPLIEGFTDQTNVMTWVVLRVFIGSKDLYLFSMLFGAGLLLMDASRRSSGDNPTASHYRRMAVLLAFGILHAYVLWAGDILVTYAIVAMVLWHLRKLRPGLQLFLGYLAVAVPLLLVLVIHFALPNLPAEFTDFAQNLLLPASEEIARHNEVYSSGWLTQMADRVPSSLINQTLGLVVCMGWIAGGMMLVGMGMYQLGIFSAHKPARTYLLMLATAALLGYPMLIYSFVWNFNHDWVVPQGFFLGWFLRETAYPIIVLGWIGAVMLICKYGRLKILTHALSAVGQMTLTNYLMQTIICSLIFYGTGLGLVGQISHLGQIWITLVIWVAQMIASPLWLKHYRMGPAEWLWRSIAAGYWHRLRLTPAVAMEPA